METTDRNEFVEDLSRRSAANKNRLSANDRSIIEHLQRHPESLAFQTSKSLADATDVSQAAVVRLSKKLGFDGFTGMRDSLRESLKGGETLAGRFARRAGSEPEREFDQDVENLLATQSRVSSDLDEAARVLNEARRVFVVGDRESYGLALFMHRRLHIILEDVRLIDPSFPDDVTCLRPDDVLFACIFPRYSRLTAELIRVARESGARIVTLTDNAAGWFVAPQDTTLIASTDSSRFHWSMVAPIAVLESVVARTAASNEKGARERLDKTDAFKRTENFFL